MKTIAFIKKDCVFSRTWIVISLLISVVAPVYFCCFSNISDNALPLVMPLTMTISSNLIISRMCFFDDDYAARKLLFTLPVHKYKIVVARYIETMMVLFIVAVVSFFVYKNINNTHSWSEIIIISSSLLLYFSVFLLCYFGWGLKVAQYSSVFIILFFLAIYYYCNYFLDTMLIKNLNYFLSSKNICLFACAVFIVSCWGSSFIYGKKNI